MSGARSDYTVGRGRPPKHTRWRKGQTGNPNRIRKTRSLDVARLIDQAFLRRMAITEGGQRRRVTVFETILLQLWTKAAKGSTRAMRVVLRYQDFAATRGGMGGVEIRFSDET